MPDHRIPSTEETVPTAMSRGLRVLSLVPMAVLGFLVVLAGCGAQPTTSPPTAQQIYQRASQSAMKDADIALSGSVTGNSSGQSFTLDMHGTGKIVVKPATAYHLAITLDLTSAQIHGTIVVDLIQVGGKLYTRTQINIPGLPPSGTGKYTAIAAPASQSSFIPSNLGNLKVVGEDTIRGDKCWHLSGVVSTNSQGTPVAAGTSGATSVNVDEWIRESDYYYVRLKLNTLPGLNLPIGGTGASGGTSTSANAGFVFDLSNYDQGIKISPPPASQIGGA